MFAEPLILPKDLPKVKEPKPAAKRKRRNGTKPAVKRSRGKAR